MKQNGLPGLPSVYIGSALAPMKMMKAAIDKETDIKKVKDFATRVAKMQLIDSENIERQNHWAELSIWSSRRLGGMLRMAQEEGTLAKQGGDKKSKGHDVRLILKDIGIEQKQSQRAQKLVDIPDETIEEYVAEQHDKGTEVSKAGLMRFATGTEKAGASAHVSLNTGIPEWYTPIEYINAARMALGEIDLDPASSKIAQKQVTAKRYYTLETNGLIKMWKGKVFLNPPYTSDLICQFIAKLCESYLSGEVPAAILIINNATETGWFQDAAKIASAMCFPKGRIRFLDENGDPGAPLQGQAILYFGKAVKRFVGAFGDFGFCVMR